MSNEADRVLHLDGESAEVRALLDAGIADEVDYDYSRGLSTHLSAIAAFGGAPPPRAAPSPSGAGGASLTSKVFLGLVGLPAVTIAVLWFGSSHGRAPVVRASEALSAPQQLESRTRQAVAPAKPESATAPPVAEPANAPLLAPQPASRIAAFLGSHRHGAAASSGVAPEALTLAETPETRAGTTDARSRATRAATSGTSSAEPPVAGMTTTESATGAPKSNEDDAAVLATEARQARVVADAKRDDARLEREMAAIVEAKRALKEDPARAVQLAQQGDRDFSGGIFGEERRHILLLALIRLGRLDEARRIAAPYLAAHPDSPFAERVRNALAAASQSAR